MSLAKNISAARKDAKLSRAALAKRIRKSRSSICEYEAGTHEPRLEVLRRIAKVTGVALQELLA